MHQYGSREVRTHDQQRAAMRLDCTCDGRSANDLPLSEPLTATVGGLRAGCRGGSWAISGKCANWSSELIGEYKVIECGLSDCSYNQLHFAVPFYNDGALL